ncbi:MAG: hypothetical protein ACKPKO_50815, partial [Candidatus Fonsibacter sp.]
SGKPAGKAILATVNGDRPAHQLVLESRKLMNRADVPANVEKAVTILRAAAEGHPDHAASHASLALALLRTNDGNPTYFYSHTQGVFRWASEFVVT